MISWLRRQDYEEKKLKSCLSTVMDSTLNSVEEEWLLRSSSSTASLSSESENDRENHCIRLIGIQDRCLDDWTSLLLRPQTNNLE